LLHHALLGFSFTGINDAVRPFFRNHVNYAAILALILPLLWFLRQLYRPFSFMWLLVLACMFICFLGVVFAYTRAAYVALILAFMAYVAIRLRLLAWAMGAAVVMVLVLSVYVVQKNKFLDYAPTERTIAHKEFDDLVAATYSFEDVSTMERYYRWIAGVRMGIERPITGFGPNCFYPHYRGYTLNKFETYISDNQERSGIHNYFLMLWVEQGIPGMLLFIFLSLGALWHGQRCYHQCQDPLQRKILMATLLSLVVINAFLLMNDLIETEKIGSFFFFHLAILVSIGRFKDGD
jgi:O-antigen ligase